MAETLDLKKVLTGKDGKVWVSWNGNTELLAEANNFVAALNFTNADVQPIGSILNGAVPVSCTVTISIKNYVIRDDIMLAPIIEALRSGARISFDFQGVLDRSMIDGQESRQVFRDCVPDGTFSLLNFTPGDVVTTESSFRGNALPEIIKAFTA